MFVLICFIEKRREKKKQNLTWKWKFRVHWRFPVLLISKKN